MKILYGILFVLMLLNCFQTVGIAIIMMVERRKVEAVSWLIVAAFFCALGIRIAFKIWA